MSFASLHLYLQHVVFKMLNVPDSDIELEYRIITAFNKILEELGDFDEKTFLDLINKIPYDVLEDLLLNKLKTRYAGINSTIKSFTNTDDNMKYLLYDILYYTTIILMYLYHNNMSSNSATLGYLNLIQNYNKTMKTYTIYLSLFNRKRKENIRTQYIFNLIPDTPLTFLNAKLENGLPKLPVFPLQIIYVTLEKRNVPILGRKEPISSGGNRKTNTVKKINKKTILGKERCIYAIQGDRKEYLRYKGNLIPVKDYKKLMKDKK
jgi:hypothetical protein